MLTRRNVLSFAGLMALPFPLRAKAGGAPSPYGSLPSHRQLRWHHLETYSFLHFTVNTFTDREWGNGDEDPNVFQPQAFDPDSIVTTLKDAGMKAVILTCKHHDGFCLWPTQTTEHSIRHSSGATEKATWFKIYRGGAAPGATIRRVSIPLGPQ